MKRRIICTILVLVFTLSLFPVFAEDATYPIGYNTAASEIRIGEELTLIASPKFPSGTKDIKYQWYVTSTGKIADAQKIDGADGSLYKYTAQASGEYYFYCEITAIYKGETVTTLDYNKMTGVAVKVKEALAIVPVGEDNVTIYNPKETVIFLVETKNASNPSISWYSCDEKGNTGKMLAIGQTLPVKGITEDMLGIPQYFACIAVDGEEVDLHIFTVTLKDESEKDKEVEEKPNITDKDNDENTEDPDDYVFPFTDVSKDDWFYADVLSAHKSGLINGKTETTYSPDDNMTYAEAVKLACAMHQLERDGKVTIPNGSMWWYSTYMDYALTEGIIDEDLSAKANDPITRKEYVYIFYKALPEENFAEINDIAKGAIPDVEDGKYSLRIYTFYRAGILTGSDEKGTFLPDSNIKRSEVAAILTRMSDKTARKNITLK
ncbi:MAG: S-layer homology domain-containing protein [Ruminococcaceae bacterium]|nr:S-layer homology domain-containing protein [Oscillospiraceae bacterium]